MEEEADSNEGEKRPKGKETKEPERDVYSFPGDSDHESPPPAPWAHCTFIQRCRRKRVLLKPFSGLGTLERTLPDLSKWARVNPQKSKPAELALLNRGGGVYELEKDNIGDEPVEELMKFKERERKIEHEEKEESEVVPGKEIFTCVECSIYFKKQVHLQEHIIEHCQSIAGSGRRIGKSNRFRCTECGWNLPNRLTLAHHHRKHQESRLKILEEIEKLNENGKAREIQEFDSKVVKHIVVDSNIIPDTRGASFPSKESDPEIVTSPPLSPVLLSTPDADPAVTDSGKTLPKLKLQNLVRDKGVSAYRHCFVCTKCNFSTRTSQALANHTKTHNRKKIALQADSPSPGSPSCLTSTSLAFDHCAFLTSSQTLMREHQELAHPGWGSTSGRGAKETGQHSKSKVGDQISESALDSEHLSGPGSVPQLDINQGKKQQGAMASEDSAIPDSQEVLGCGENTECSQQETISPIRLKPLTRARSDIGETLLDYRF